MANTSPIFVKNAKNWFLTPGTAANTALDGTGTVATLMTADATNGSYVNKIRVTHLGTNVATVLRIFINNGSANSTAANNALIKEIALPSNSLSQTAVSVAYEIPLNLPLAAGYKLNMTLGTAVAAGHMVEAEGGDF
jgi:hypothetical protein